VSVASSIVRVIDGLLALGPRPAGRSPLSLPRAEAVIHPAWTRDEDLGTALRNIALDKGFSDRLFAVVDFTNIPVKPSGVFGTTPTLAYASWNGKMETRIASMAKVAVMYAAFQLLADLKRLSFDPTARDQAALRQLAQQEWERAPEPLVQRIVADTQVRGIDRIVRTLRGGPDQTTMFDFQHPASWLISFKSTGEDASEVETINDLASVADPTRPGRTMEDPTYRSRVASLGFLERMKLMIRFSNDVATASCVRDIGFPYITALLAQSGLFHPGEEPAGLFLASNYDGFEVEHVPSRNFADESTQTSQAGNAEALARFMTLLLQGRLVDEASSKAMKTLLAKETSVLMRTGGARSFALEGVQRMWGLPPVFTAPSRAHSKIGLFLHTDTATNAWHVEASDVVYIVRPLDNGTRLRYVVFALGSATAPTRAVAVRDAITVVGALAGNLDQVLVNRHTESSP
jgi:hypothetical protein